MNENDETMKFTVLDDNGNEVECEVLFTFESDETGKNYLIYTDNSMDEDGNVNIFASSYDPDADESKLMPLETERELEIIQAVLNEVQNAEDDEN